MRIADGDGNRLDSILLAPSNEEAAELAQALASLQSADRGWHEHVSDLNGQIEITVYREDDESAVL
jgi:hypothetical protein